MINKGQDDWSKWGKNTLKGVMAAILSGCLLGGQATGQEVWERDLSTYQHPYLAPAAQKEWNFAKPLWTVDTWKQNFSPIAPAAEGDKIWAVTRDGLTAFQVSNGKIMWQQNRTGFQGLVKLGDIIYATTTSGLLTAYDAETGKIRWAEQVLDSDGAMPCTVEGDLYVYWNQGLVRINPETGKILWRVDKKESFSGGLPLVLKDVVFQTYMEQGVLTTGVLYAFDRETGQELWSGWGMSAPLAQVDNTVYVENIHWMTLDDNRAATIIALGLYTGKEIKTTVYPRPATKPFGGVASFPKHKAIHDGYIYIDVDGAINRYPLGIDPSLVIDGDLTVSGIGDWIAGPVENRLIYQGEFDLSSMPVDRMSSVYYQGVNNPVAYLKVFGRALFVGQSDGRILVNDFFTGKNVFIAQTEARTYHFLKVIGDNLVVQADEKILVYHTPGVAGLSAARLPAETAKPVLGKATFVIDGKTIDLEADPAWVDNQLLVPFRALFQALGAEVDYDADSKQVVAKKGEKTVILTVDQKFGLLNGVQVGTSPVPQLIDGKLYVPARSVCQALDYQVKWQYSSKTVEITSIK